MKDFKMDRYSIVTVTFMIFIFAFMVGTMVHVIGNRVNKSLTPKDDMTGVTQQITGSISQVNPLAKGIDLVKNTTSKVEASFITNMFLKNLFIDYNGLFQRIVEKRVIEDADFNNKVIKDSSQQLTFVCPKIDINEYVKSMVQLKAYLDKSGVKLLFVQAPYKILDGYTKLPPTIEDFANENADSFLQGLAQNNIDYMDLRQEIMKDNLNRDDLFFKTDHHWQIQTAFWAFTKVAKRLSNTYGFDTNTFYTDIENYNQKTYKNIFLGSQGIRVGKYYAGIDDFTLITPKFSTDYKVTIKESTDNITEYTGGFNQAIIRNDLIDISKSVSTNRYATYLTNPGCPEITIENNTYLNNKKILLIKDSFAMPLSAFLSLTTQEIKILDLRYYRGGTLFDYLKNYSPDIVLFLYNPGVYSDNTNQIFTFK